VAADFDLDAKVTRPLGRHLAPANCRTCRSRPGCP
jgi:hypothetical protein